jgi:hypothetical protein
VKDPLAPVDARGPYQNLYAKLPLITRGRNGVCCTMNWSVLVYVAALELLRF